MGFNSAFEWLRHKRLTAIGNCLLTYRGVPSVVQQWHRKRLASVCSPVGDSELALYRAVSVDSGRLNWVGVDIVNFCAVFIIHANHVTSSEVLPQCSRATPRRILLFPVALFLRQPTL